ncbi:hypothetical protein CathTA2_2606 [Caldalkalibacillus thermarum TA2.A1]|uniref:DUF2621 domain-containing protein n=1 Tax=Caldalkalibacillus thermarum (strain TA2.A1) TaxID=986075 RepID=F5L9V1_CALTT|nr:DUF2621 family protein [Caldalkalibacillus thermarum]EGL81821.1 hypothetical protein CathTA2_2606 [Caldalkalibacillus thermarum TA2.A1]QZT34312.1 DUF2621 domain-containing protein [Caldalkalibacillus thermarum TA2.A1]GGK35866.1 hypothetical protein GCM10010965_31020 [Caldalkalibacillus thermarum]
MEQESLPLIWQYLVVIIPTIVVVMIMIGGFFMFRKFLSKWPKKDDRRR